MTAPKLAFRRARAEDLPHIIAMLADDELGATREDPSVPPNPRYIAAFTAINQDSNQFMAVVEQDSHLVGCLQLSFHTRPVAAGPMARTNRERAHRLVLPQPGPGTRHVRMGD